MLSSHNVITSFMRLMITMAIAMAVAATMATHYSLGFSRWPAFPSASSVRCTVVSIGVSPP